MEKLKNTPKITIATLKSFAKRNQENIYYKITSDFDGMTDCVQAVNSRWKKTTCNVIIMKANDPAKYYKTGIFGIYTVGGSRNYFSLYEDTEYFGIRIYNCCGSSILAIKK